MTLNMSLEQWKAGIPQRELERKIREYEESCKRSYFGLLVQKLRVNR